MKLAPIILFSTAICLSAPPQGTVHIYRQKLEIGTVVRPTVTCDNFPVVRLPNGSVFTMNMSEGRHQIATGDNPTGIYLDVESGKEHYVRIDFPANASHASRATPIQVPLDQGRMETIKLKVLDASYIEAATCGK